ncbi:hypothetical protein L218DRAFT_930803 [Marasmius fiardii PR-910]|nr:hypothetical protein L218DRAFT_930803 [Marasmius fiardii PR-910]
MSVRPFSPTESFSFPKPPSSAGNESRRRTRGMSVFSDVVDPFADIHQSPVGGVAAGVGVVIRRPFLPTRDDELAVVAGDRVTIVQVFDDGWVAVRKRDVEGGPGLIPVDCLREQGQELPEFLAAKRVSSYVVVG